MVDRLERATSFRICHASIRKSCSGSSRQAAPEESGDGFLERVLMEQEQTRTANGFNDWEHLHSLPPPSSHQSRLSTLSSSPTNVSVITAARDNSYDDFSIFPPINHEGLPLLSQSTTTHYRTESSSTALNSRSNDTPPPDSPTSSSNSAPQQLAAKLGWWFNFALQLLNSKVVAIFSSIRSRGMFCSLHSSFTGPMSMAALLVVLGLWAWWRKGRRRGREESIEHLKLLMREKDEDLHTRKKIGGGYESGGLYYLDEPALQAGVVSEDFVLRWHHRLGHPPVPILRHFVSIPFSFSRFNCDACQYGKHH
ncbi:hypothetical protein Ancab_035962 [Ancistrocladus abbreviatus]